MKSRTNYYYQPLDSENAACNRLMISLTKQFELSDPWPEYIHTLDENLRGENYDFDP